MEIQMKGRRSVYRLAAFVAAAVAGSASAATITFTLGDSPAGNTNPFFYHHSSGFSVTSGGYTLTFSNPGGAPHQNTTTNSHGTWTTSWLPDNELAFERDSWGLTIGNFLWHWYPGPPVPYPGYTDSFTMTLTGPTDLVLTGYEINFVDVPATLAGGFVLTQGGSPVSTGNALDTVGTFGIGGGPVLWQRGTSLEFQAADVNAFSLATLASLTFQVSAIPGSGVAAIGSLGLAGFARRRRR